MINVYNQIELLSKLPALTFLSRSQSTIANFPKYTSLEISQKSTLPYQTGWMELANWGGNSFLRNCKPKILRKFWLNFFNQYLPWFFLLLLLNSLPLYVCVWHFGLEIVCHYTSKTSLLNELSLKKDLFFLKIFSMSSISVSISIFSSAIDLSMVLALEFILAERTVGPTQPKSGCFQVFYSKTARLFPKISGGISINKVSLGLNDKW